MSHGMVFCISSKAGCYVCPGKGILNMFYRITQGKSVATVRGKIWGVEAEPVARYM